jgi:hypothetical protein
VGPRSLFRCGGIEINPGPFGSLDPICCSPTEDNVDDNEDDDDNNNNRHYNVTIIYFF